MDDEDDEEEEFPSFGDSQSDYDTVSIFNTHLCFFFFNLTWLLCI